MLIKNVPLVISGDDPFANDELKRKESIFIITQLLKNINQPFVLSIDSSFGTGKTTFVKMLEQHLIKSDFKTLYFNAWENDYMEEPFSALVGEISSQLSESETLRQKVNSEAYSLLTYLLKAGGSVGIRLLTSGYIDGKTIAEMIGKGITTAQPGDELSKTISEGISQIAEGIAKDQIDNYLSHKDLLNKFKKALGDYFKENTKPLVFFIDELDRCRPTFAVELLERLKHLFDVKGLIFVLSIDKKQLCSSLKTLYGTEIDTNGYLRRFIDLEYHLPDPSVEDYCTFLWKVHGLTELIGKDCGDTVNKAMAILCRGLDLKLRDIEKCYTRLTIVLMSTPGMNTIYLPLLSIMLVLIEHDKDMYNKLLEGTLGIDAINKHKRKAYDTEPNNSTDMHTINTLKIYMTISNMDRGKMSNYVNGIVIMGSADDKEQQAVAICNSILEIHSAIKLPMSKYLKERIEIQSRFSEG